MAGTQNGWNNQISSAINQIILNAGTNGVAISTDASAATVNVATGGAVKTTTLGSTNSTSTTTVQSGSGVLNVTSTGGALTVNSGTGALSISNDASATTVTVATGGAVKTATFGSTNSTSTTTVQSGSGVLNVTSTGGALTVNSGTGALGISTDASATTVSLATGGAVKTVTLGSTNSTSVTTVACGTGGANFGTSANAHATIVGSTTAASTTTIQAPSAGVILTGVQGVAVANKNYVTINTSTGAIGSDAGPSSSSGNLTLIQTLTASSSANISFTSGVTGFDCYKILIYGMIPQTTNTILQMTFSNDGGGSYQATEYYNSGVQYSSNGTVTGAFSQQNGSVMFIGAQVSNSTTWALSATITLYLLGSSAVAKNGNIVATYLYQGATELLTVQAGSAWNGTAAVNAIRFTMSSGNINSGTFKLFGVVN